MDLYFFIQEFSWARSLVRDVLQSIPESMLMQSPIPGGGSWGQQFRHIGRVQENYIQAIESGIATFTTEGCSYKVAVTKVGLLDYLNRMDEKFSCVLSSTTKPIDWFGELWSIERHIRALASHEILHHGQLILYSRASCLQLPQSWKIWGEG